MSPATDLVSCVSSCVLTTLGGILHKTRTRAQAAGQKDNTPRATEINEPGGDQKTTNI
jgi:hypothetical protein